VSGERLSLPTVAKPRRNWFPFGNAVTTDPFSGNTDAILKRRPTDPLMIEVNTSTEYWQKGASLVHTDPAGMMPNCRLRRGFI